MTDDWSVVYVEDDAARMSTVTDRIAAAGLNAVLCESLEQGMREINRLTKLGRLAAVIADLAMPGKELPAFGGWEAISYAQKVNPGCPIAIYSGKFAEFEIIVRATSRIPEFHYFAKTRDIDKLGTWLVDIAEGCRGRSAIVVDPQVREIYEQLAPVYAPSGLPVLIVGQSGTGKESLAREIHAKSGRGGPFVSVNCGAFDDSLVLAELFGSERGAWTDSQAHKLGLVLHASGYRGEASLSLSEITFDMWIERSSHGNFVRAEAGRSPALHGLARPEETRGTLFLDEITCLPANAMAGLLRVLSTQDVRPYGYVGPGFRSYCRIIAATNDLNALQEAGTQGKGSFRRDLFYRLSGVVLNLPPVRDSHVIDEFLTSYHTWNGLGLHRMGFAQGAKQLIYNLYLEDSNADPYYQQGNFRTLRNLLQRAALIALQDGSVIYPEHVNAAIQHGKVDLAAAHRDDERSPDRHIGHIRSRFMNALHEHGVDVKKGWFSFAELKALSTDRPIVVADAFIQCCLSERETPHARRESYTLGEVEEALTTSASRNAWISKALTKDAVREAAIKFYRIPAGQVPGPDASINSVMQTLRRLGGKRKQASINV